MRILADYSTLYNLVLYSAPILLHLLGIKGLVKVVAFQLLHEPFEVGNKLPYLKLKTQIIPLTLWQS